jgi:YafQ family addiction module toxin component
MARQYKTSKNLDRILLKLLRKNKKLYEQVLNKIDEVINSNDVEHYKNLRYGLKRYKRVHVGDSFVLVFKYDKQNDFIYFDDFNHHDKIYKK